MDKEEVLKLANLARIGITEAEAEELTKEFQPILKYVSDVKIAQAEDGEKKKEDYPVRNRIREDANPHSGDIYTQELLADAPEKDGRYIRVKKIL